MKQATTIFFLFLALAGFAQTNGKGSIRFSLTNYNDADSAGTVPGGWQCKFGKLDSISKQGIVTPYQNRYQDATSSIQTQLNGKQATGSYLTSGGALGTPSSGNLSNCTNVPGAWTVVKVAGSDFTTTGQTLVDITGLSFSATASTTYLIEAWLDCTTSAVTTGVEFGVNSTGGSPVVLWNVTGNLASTTAASAGNVANNTADATAFLTTSGMEGFIHIWGIVKSGTGTPTISIRGLKVTSGTLTVKIGSRLMYQIQ